MAGAFDLAKMVPGFDFLQNLMKGAGGAMPGMGQWIAPTLNPDELAKRIGELKTVQFWLDSNAKLLGTTIQALEVQRMTLSTLQTMNLPLTDLRDALQIKPAAVASQPEAAPAPPPEPAPTPAPAVAKAPAAVDPLQWWSALTQQFAELASQAVKDGAVDTARKLAGGASQQTGALAGETAKSGKTVRRAAAPAAAKRRRGG